MFYFLQRLQDNLYVDVMPISYECFNLCIEKSCFYRQLLVQRAPKTTLTMSLAVCIVQSPSWYKSHDTQACSPANHVICIWPVIGQHRPQCCIGWVLCLLQNSGMYTVLYPWLWIRLMVHPRDFFYLFNIWNHDNHHVVEMCMQKIVEVSAL